MIFWLKLFLTPSLIAALTLIIRRWGTTVGGLLSGLPVVAGPISYFLYVENGSTFAANAATGSLLGSLGIGTFTYTYTKLSLAKKHWSWCLLAAYIANISTIILISKFVLSLFIAFTVSFIVTCLTLLIFPKFSTNLPSRKAPKFDIPVRMLVAGTFVILLVEVSKFLGPQWSGLLTPFPILTPILAVFTHLQQGADSSAAALKGLVIGSFGFIVFFFFVGLLLTNYPPLFSYSVAVSLAVMVNLGILRFAKNL